MALAAGTRLGHYEIREPLGAGGMGEVYRAFDPKLGRDVAIKILTEAFGSPASRNCVSQAGMRRSADTSPAVGVKPAIDMFEVVFGGTARLYIATSKLN